MAPAGIKDALNSSYSHFHHYSITSLNHSWFYIIKGSSAHHMANVSALPAGKYEPMTNALLSFVILSAPSVWIGIKRHWQVLSNAATHTEVIGRRAQAHLVQHVSVRDLFYLIEQKYCLFLQACNHDYSPGKKSMSTVHNINYSWLYALGLSAHSQPDCLPSYKMNWVQVPFSQITLHRSVKTISPTLRQILIYWKHKRETKNGRKAKNCWMPRKFVWVSREKQKSDKMSFMSYFGAFFAFSLVFLLQFV